MTGQVVFACWASDSMQPVLLRICGILALFDSGRCDREATLRSGQDTPTWGPCADGVALGPSVTDLNRRYSHKDDHALVSMLVGNVS